MTDEQILELLEHDGSCWRDWFLVGAQPIICRLSEQQLLALVIEDDELFRTTIALLRARGARSFSSVGSARTAFGLADPLPPDKRRP